MNLNTSPFDKKNNKNIYKEKFISIKDTIIKKSKDKFVNMKNIDTKKMASSIKSIDKEKMSAFQAKALGRLDILKDQIIGLINGKKLLYELISLNKKVILWMFLSGLIVNSIISISINIGDFQKKVKKQEISNKLLKIETDKKVKSDKKFNHLDYTYKKRLAGTYSLADKKAEQDLLKILAKKIKEKSNNYIEIKVISVKEDIESNTLIAKLDVNVKRLIMRPILINSLIENGYFIELFSYDKLILRKIKDK